MLKVTIYSGAFYYTLEISKLMLQAEEIHTDFITVLPEECNH